MSPKRPLRVEQRRIHSQVSWLIRNDEVELAVTRLGGHMAPVTFYRGSRQPIQPYYLSPWQDERVQAPVPVLAPLRGDFFCLPFGGNQQPFRGERHPPHGETSGGLWQLEGATAQGPVSTLALRFKSRARRGIVRRELSLVSGHNVVYSRIVIEGFAGPTPFAHHAILALPRREGALRLSSSPFRFGRTYPTLLSSPAAGEYQYLAIDSEFHDLAKVASIFRREPPADCTAFPARRGFCDIVQTFEQPPRGGGVAPSWVAAVNTESRWLWFAFKDPRVMPGRVLWMENGGRHGPPWNGRNACLGIEDGCMNFDLGLAASCRPNPINRRGIPTCVELSDEQPFEIRYLQGVARVPSGFDRVRAVQFGPGAAAFCSASGKRLTVKVAPGFVLQDDPPTKSWWESEYEKGRA
jgi:hypothetical protein